MSKQMTEIILGKSTEDGDVTFAMVQATVGDNFEGSLLHPIRRAVTQWLTSTEDGRRVNEQSTYGFKIEDLYTYVSDPFRGREPGISVGRFLSDEGVEIKNIEVHSGCYSISDVWSCDTHLNEEKG